MIVGGNGGKLDSCIDQEVDKGRLHLGLTRLEVIATNECAFTLSKIDCAGNECILRGAIDERRALEDGGNGKDSRWGDFFMASLDRMEQIIRCVVDTGDDVSEALSIGSPENDDLVQVVGVFECSARVSLQSDVCYAWALLT